MGVRIDAPLLLAAPDIQGAVPHPPTRNRCPGRDVGMITMLGYDQAQDAQTITLLDLVAAIAETGASEDEVIATVAHLMASGRVTLIGNFREAELASLDHGG